MNPRYLLLLVVVLAHLMTGCAGTSAIYPYPARISPVLHRLETGRPIDVDEVLQRGLDGRDRVLYRLERGRAAQITGQRATSMTEYSAAVHYLEAEDEKAVLRASTAMDYAATAIINDNAIAYRPRGYERIFLHHYQAWNFLADQNLQGAAVEVRRIDAEQTQALERQKQEIDWAKRAAEQNRLDWAALEKQSSQAGAAGEKLAADTVGTGENAYTYYLSALIYELAGELEDACIDYRKASIIAPDSHYIAGDLGRLGRKLGKDLAAGDGTALEPIETPGNSEYGELVVLFENDIMPSKEEAKIVVPIPHERLTIVSVAVPSYPPRRGVAGALRVKLAGKEELVAEPIADLYGIAAASLRDEMPSILVRQVTRTITKVVAAEQARKQFGDLAFLGAQLFNVLTENADLRGWSTLPDEVQLARVRVPAGQAHLRLEHPEIHEGREVDVEIVPHGTTILQVIRVGDNLYIDELVFHGSR